jgi:hypothetical protein
MKRTKNKNVLKVPEYPKEFIGWEDGVDLTEEHINSLVKAVCEGLQTRPHEYCQCGNTIVFGCIVDGNKRVVVGTRYKLYKEEDLII